MFILMLILIAVGVWVAGALVQLPHIIKREQIAYLEKRDEIQDAYESAYEDYKKRKQQGGYANPPESVERSLEKAQKARNKLMRTFAWMALLWPVSPAIWTGKTSVKLSVKGSKATWSAFWNHIMRRAEIQHEINKEFNAMKFAEMTATEQNAATRGLAGTVEPGAEEKAERPSEEEEDDLYESLRGDHYSHFAGGNDWFHEERVTTYYKPKKAETVKRSVGA